MFIDEILKEIAKVSEEKNKLQDKVRESSVVSCDILKKLKSANLKLRILRLTLENIKNNQYKLQQQESLSSSLLYEDYYSGMDIEQLKDELKSGYIFMQEIEDQDEKLWVWKELKKIKSLLDKKTVKRY